MLGLKHTTVKLVPHSCKWQYLFQEEVINLRKVLNNRTLWIEHVGSTALPNIAAKPILDIFVACDIPSSAIASADTLAILGYELVTNGSDYKLFIKGSKESRTHHLTFANPQSAYWKETIQFREYLLEHPTVAKAYEIEKLKLAESYPDSRRNYTANKAKFIQKVLRQIPKDTYKKDQLIPQISLQTNKIVISKNDVREFTYLDQPSYKNTSNYQIEETRVS